MISGEHTTPGAFDAIVASIYMIIGMTLLLHNESITRSIVRDKRYTEKLWTEAFVNPLRKYKWCARLEDRTDRGRTILMGIGFVAMAIQEAVRIWR